MYQGIPIIGIVGGIGSGKSHVARKFGELGCLVISSDEQVTQAYALPEVQDSIRRRWGDAAVGADGSLNRKLISARVFGEATERAWLERLIHPVVARLRDAAMRAATATTPRPLAFIWDAPLLFEAGLGDRCDAVVFVDAPLSVRLDRVRRTRGWDAGELELREKSQWALDKKRAMSHHVVANRSDFEGSRPALTVPASLTDLHPTVAAVTGQSSTVGVAAPLDLDCQVSAVLGRIVGQARTLDRS